MSLCVIPLRNRIQDAALECAKVKKPNPLLEEIRFEIVQGGTCVQILHIGAYDDEPVSFAMLDKFTRALSLIRAESCHREIYLNNANRTEKSKLKTILRYMVKQFRARVVGLPFYG